MAEEDSSRMPIRYALGVGARTTATIAGGAAFVIAGVQLVQGDVGGAMITGGVGSGLEGAAWGDKVVPKVVRGVRRLAGRGRQQS